MDGGVDFERYILEHFDEALANHYIQVYVQPVIRTISRQVCGLEALARWQDPVLGLLTPDKFIGVLERHRRIHELDSYVVRWVCRRLGQLQTHQLVPVSVNLSRLDYELCDIFEVVETAVRANKVSRENLCIEITESVLANNEALMRRYIDRFQAAGYPVWMDDFGSGYSSLNVLKDYAFNELKIDMRFLSDFHTRSKKILASIVHMAKEIDIQTLAEGVETEAQFEFLRNIGCEKAQGFLFGKPMPYDVCMKHIESSGMRWEPAVLRSYYDAWGRVDVLSATPFFTAADRSPDNITGRELNSIPLALLELRGDAVDIVFTNHAFDKTATDVNWQMVLDRSYRMDAIPLNRLSRHISRLLEETRVEGKGRMLAVFNDEYYELLARRIAAYRDTCGILLRVINLSQSAELDNQKKLDDGLRSLYSVYEQVSVLSLEENTVSPIYMDADAREVPQQEPLGDYIARCAATQIYPEDRDRFLRFAQPETLEARMAQAGTGSIGIHLRTLTFHGIYAWKCYLLARIRENFYYLLVRDASGEVREFQSATNARPDAGQVVTPELLWNNVVNNSALKFFWKDSRRRFLGASRAFLDHYDFKSKDEIVGKTDEDMGWHIHPDLYRAVELSVLREGVVSRQVVGTCLVQGENKSIIANKMPLYDTHGDIVGLIGYFFQEGTMGGGSEDFHRARTDSLTGLLNSRGIYEDLFAYVDEYQLRGTDFVRIEVAIDDFAAVNARYGYDFGDEVIRRAGKALLGCVGNKATVGRMMGCYFTVLTQFESREALDELIARIRDIPSAIRRVDGMPFSMYLSVGSAIYSESENREDQEKQAQMRRMTDDVENISPKKLRENTSRIFRMYDDLPLAYAVYKVMVNAKGTDAILLYANREFSAMTGLPPEKAVGRWVGQLFPMDNAPWYELAVRAGFKNERITSRVSVPHLKQQVTVTAHPVIGPGFCAFTYQMT